jgi:AcrR family transcriptional regulator
MASKARPRGSTRERILDVALELFNEQGYDKTSLREIADRLGVTKAALYYHFERKEDILLELHLRLHALGRDVFDQFDKLYGTTDTVAAWSALLDRFIDEVVANRPLFLLHERNRSAMEELSRSERHQAEQDDLEQRARSFLGNTAIPLTQRVRMACSIAAVVGVLLMPGETFGDATKPEIAELVRKSVRDLLA